MEWNWSHSTRLDLHKEGGVASRELSYHASEEGGWRMELQLGPHHTAGAALLHMCSSSRHPCVVLRWLCRVACTQQWARRAGCTCKLQGHTSACPGSTMAAKAAPLPLAWVGCG